MDSLESAPFSYQVQTYGCKVNSYDTGLLQKRLTREGWWHSKDSEVVVLNTCAVTAEATKEALRAVRKIKREKPHSVVVVTGCAAQVDTDKFVNLSDVDLVVANSHKGNLDQILRDRLSGRSSERLFKSNIFKKEDLEAGGGEELSHTRSFLKIQDGCNSFCTFCVIPFARGKSRSIEIPELVRAVNELYDKGVREAVLTGVHIGDYEDGEKKLEDLVEALLLNTAMPRFRLSSLEPIELSARLMDLYEEPRLCPHFHMSIQSAQTQVLHKMKRKYGSQEVEGALNGIYKRFPQAFVGMDVIAGFAGETDEEFEETYKRLQSLPWTRIHVFPYSDRPGTYASRVFKKEELHRHEVMERAKRLRELSLERYTQKALEQVGTTKSVLKLSYGNKALSRDYWPVTIESGTRQAGEEFQVRITGCDHSNASRVEAGLIGV